MRILVAPDSYKGSLQARKVAEYMEQGIRDVYPNAEVFKLPIADGGEGTVEAMVTAVGGHYRELEVTGPLGEPVQAVFGVLSGNQTAVIEMAAASGLSLVPKGRLNPSQTTSYGTGELIRAALDCGCRKIIVGLGGSATNDGGVGALQALGVRFLNEREQSVGFGGGALSEIRRIDISGLDPRIAECELIIASDVTNPLCGHDGASAVFGPQKGANPEMVGLLDSGLRHLSRLSKETFGEEVDKTEGAGAAGGLGFGLIAFLHARMGRGIDIVLEAANFEEVVRQSDLVLTGEGRTDSQTAFGKAPAGVAAIAKKYGKPVICVSGGITTDVQSLYDVGMDAVIGVTQSPMTLDEAMKRSPASIRHAVSSIFRILAIPHKHHSFLE